MSTSFQTPTASAEAPRTAECLCCYLFRMLDEHGCDKGLRWSGIWRDSEAPDIRGLERILRSAGGYCDCEVLANVRSPLFERAPGDPVPPCQALQPGEMACVMFG